MLKELVEMSVKSRETLYLTQLLYQLWIKEQAGMMKTSREARTLYRQWKNS